MFGLTTLVCESSHEFTLRVFTLRVFTLIGIVEVQVLTSALEAAHKRKRLNYGHSFDSDF